MHTSLLPYLGEVIGNSDVLDKLVFALCERTVDCPVLPVRFDCAQFPVVAVQLPAVVPHLDVHITRRYIMIYTKQDIVDVLAPK